MNIRIVAGILVAVIVLAVFFYPKPLRERYRESRVIEGETVTIDVCLERGAKSAKAGAALDRAWQRMREIRHRMGHAVDSDVARINRSFAYPQVVGGDTIDLLKRAMRDQRLTGGAFTVADGALIDLWERGQKDNRLPSAQEIAAAKKSIDLSAIDILPGNKVQLKIQAMRVNLDEISRGYAIDRTVEALRRQGYKNFLLDVAGHRYASGFNCQGKPWAIAVNHPKDSSKILDVIKISNAAMSSVSGHAHPYTIQGKKYSGIINPTTGYPSSGVLGSAVIAPTATDSCVLAMALNSLNSKQGGALIDSSGDGFAALSVVQERNSKLSVYKSSRYPSFEMKKHSR